MGKAGLQGRVGEVETLGKAACDGEVEGKVHEEVKAEELADDAGSGSPCGRDWGSPGCCAGASEAQTARSLPRAPPCSLIPCSCHSLLISPDAVPSCSYRASLNLFSFPKTLLPPLPIHPTLVFPR